MLNRPHNPRRSSREQRETAAGGGSGSGGGRQALYHRGQAYGPRIPSLRPGQRQSLYDWPQMSADDNYDNRAVLPPLIMDRSTGAMDLDAGLPPLSLRPYAGRDPAASSLRYVEAPPTPGDSPFRMAVMQSLRNSNPRRSQRYRSAQVPEWSNDEGRTGRSDASIPRLEWRDGDPVGLHNDYIRTGREVFTLVSPLDSGVPPPSPQIMDAIRYLSDIRRSSSAEESLHLATSSGLHIDADWLEYLHMEDPDGEMLRGLLLDTKFLGVAETSWLKVGGVFWGTQTTPPACQVVHTPPRRYAYAPTPSLYSSTTAGVPQSFREPRRSSSGSSVEADKNTSMWAVKVSITSVDYNEMRLTGTMEAFPDWQKGSINTYLEGEIVDFNTYTLRTTNLDSTLEADAQNWRKLEPFCKMENGDMVKGLLSRKFMRDLTDDWVFMRWKEKRFLTPQQPDPETGSLTIGGFYYLSMRRSDGKIQGFYHDPGSAPNQKLELTPQKRLFPTYQFR